MLQKHSLLDVNIFIFLHLYTVKTAVECKYMAFLW